MHILLTGTSGRIGSHTLKYFVARGHSITALDRAPLPHSILSSLQPHREAFESVTCDLTKYKEFESALKDAKPDGVIHLAAIPNPDTDDPRDVHNTNVTASYNVLETSAREGIRRIVQASSVNAGGLAYTPDDHHFFPELPITEESRLAPEDAYALSKAICEVQAAGLARYYPGLRIASLRFHMCKPTYADAVQASKWQEGFAWTSLDAASSACLLGLTSGGWDGHHAFNIAAPEICWEGGITALGQSSKPLADKKGTLELMETMWKGRYGDVREEWFAKRPRASVWDSTKAERMLGWDHDAAGQK